MGHTQTSRLASDGAGYIFFTDHGSGAAADGSVWQYTISSQAATPIASTRWTPQGIGVDSNYVFWSEPFKDQIIRYPRLGGSTITNPTGSGSGPTGVAVGGSAVYYTLATTGFVETTPESSWAPTPIDSSQTSPWALSLDSTHVYWVDFTNGGAVGQHFLGGATHQLDTGAFPVRVASDGAQVYWVNQGSGSDGQVVGCTPVGCTPFVYVDSLNLPVGLAIDANAVYFGTTGDHTLWEMVR
jgi:hypothetical protein